LAEALVRHLDVEGEFYIDDAGRGPWIRLPRLDGTMSATGLSASQVLTGDPGLAVLVLAAVLDYTLSQSPARREDVAHVERLFGLFRRAGDAFERRAAESR
jgi:hypothetical protein